MSQQPPPGPPPGQTPGQPVPPAPGGAPYAGTAAGPTDAQGRPLAEWWKRLVAAIIDGIIVGIPLNIIFSIVGVGFATSTEFEVDPNTGAVTTTDAGMGFFGGLVVMSLIYLVLYGAYFVYFHGNERGQTPGKMIMKIQVRDEATGGALGYGKAALRMVVGWALSWFTCGIGGLLDGLWPLWDPKRQALHDKAANTLVIDIG